MSHWKDDYIISWLECIKLQQSIWLNEQGSRKRCSKTQVDSNNLWCSQTLEASFIQILSQNNFKVPITLCALSRLKKKRIDRVQSPIQVIQKTRLSTNKLYTSEANLLIQKIIRKCYQMIWWNVWALAHSKHYEIWFEQSHNIVSWQTGI